MSEENKNKSKGIIIRKDDPKPLAKKSWIGENKSDTDKFRKAMEIPNKPIIKPKKDN